MSYNSEVLADSPIRYWKLDDSTGTDTMGNGNLTKGTSTAAPTTGVTGQSSIGSAWSFDGGDEASFTMPTITTAFTFEAFFKCDGATKGSHTFWRADGSDVGVVRMQGNGSVYPGQIYGVIGSAEFNTGTAYNDNNWHHLVVAVNGTSVKVYVDGTLKNDLTSGKSSYSFGTTGYLGRDSAGATNEWLIGSLDNVAFYNTQLSGTRVSAHYSNRASTTENVTAAGVTAATSTAVAVDPSFAGPERYTTDLTTYDAGEWTYESGVSGSHSDGKLTLTSSSGTFRYARWNKPADVSGLATGLIRVKRTSGTSVAYAGFDGTATAVASVPADGLWYWVRLEKTASITRSRIWENSQSEPTSWDNGSNLGTERGFKFGLDSDDTLVIDYMAFDVKGNSISLPTLPAENVSATADPATASATAPDAAVNIWAGYSPEPFTGSGELVMPPVGYTHMASPATASAEAGDAVFATDQNAGVLADPATASGVLEAPAEARGDITDAYYREILNTTDADDHWFRMDETSGTSAAARVGGTGAVSDFTGTYVGSYNFNVSGPEGRKSVHFDNGYLSAVRSQSLVNEFTFETTIRTTDGNGILAYGLDNVPGSSANFRNTIYMKNGRVAIDFGAAGEVIGIKNIADGQWHHVVVSWGTGSSKVLDTGFRVYVDGKLDIRRSFNTSPGVIATPDYYYGVPDAVRVAGQVKNFTGDVMETVFRTSTDLDEGTSAQLYYAAMGIEVIKVPAASASAEMAEAKGKGNQKRALVLYFQSINNGPIVNNSGQTYVGEWQSNPEKGDFEFGAVIPMPGQVDYEEKLVAQGYRLFYTSVNLNGSFQYRDPVTDLPVLLDLTKDGIPEQFDLIFYRNFPNEGSELDALFAQGFTMQSLEDHLASLRRCVDAGISLWVSDPYLANLLGIIDRVEFISTLREEKLVKEQGDNQMYLWDEHSSATNAFGRGAAWEYLDMYRNNRERVVASIDGMTTLEGNIVKEAQLYTPHEIYSWNIQPFYKYEERPNGLLIGDEYVEPTMLWNDNVRFNYSEPGYGQYRKGMYAVPPGAVKSGTVVTKLGNKIWTEGNVEIDNPYKDYAGTIVVQPGDSLKGRQVGGKILFTISQDPRYAVFEGMDYYLKQIVPPNEEMNQYQSPETPEQRAWQYSATRVIIGGGDINSGTDKVLVKSTDSQSGEPVFELVAKNKSGLSRLTIEEKYPTETVIISNMIQRGLAWLGIRPQVGAGDKIVRADGMSATGAMPEPVVTAQKSAEVVVEPALSNASMPSPVGYGNDVIVLAFPASATGVMTNYERKIVVPAFESTGVLVEPLGVTAQRDTIVLYINGPRQINLYLEEKN